MSKDYNAEQIQVLEGLEAVRKRPGMYIGSTSKKGLHHLVYEVIDNSIDEYLAGFGDKITTIINEDNTISIRDYGRGIPVSIHPRKGIPTAELVLTVLHAGGKFGGEDSGYKVSGGLHGVGISVVNALSEELELKVYRNNKIYKQNYKKGKPINELKDIGKSQETGTEITFKPDTTIFENTTYEFDILEKRLKESAYLNKGLNFELIDKRSNKKENFCYEGGLKSFVKDLNKDKKILIEDLIYIEEEIEKNYVEVAIQYSENYNEDIKTFANNINTNEGGHHLTGFKSAITRTFNKVGNKLNLFNKKGPKPKGSDFREGITAIVSVKLEEPEFEGQTKSKLGNSEIRAQVQTVVSNYLEQYLERNPKFTKTVLNKALTAVKAREASKKARDLVKRKSNLSPTSLPGKLADCSSKNPAESEVFLVEGDSAGGSAKLARDRKYQAILPLKGKILNCERAKLSKMLKNSEIKAMIKALGVGIGEEFNIEKLRYHKIIIMTDADVDGSHITTLILTFFYRYMPKLIEAGYIYIANSPLYKVKRGREMKYLYSDKELQTYLKKHNKSKVGIQRYKGLGEMNPKELSKTTMNKENRNLEKITIRNEEETDNTFSLLMGKKVQPRKDFIIKHSKDVENIDV